MSSPCGCRAMEACCTSACCISHHKTGGDGGGANTTTRSSRSNFAISAVSALFPNSEFTNHESLPSLQEAFSIFSSAFPYYFETMLQADLIRETEYPHLSDQICLDYSGVGLFSHSQAYNISSSSQPSPFFNISYKSASLKFEVQYGEQDTGFESYIKKHIMSFLKISPDDYVMICTANRTTAFRLLAETYPFQSNRRLLTVYDYESEAIKPMVECALNRGAKVKSATFSWPGLSIHTRKLKKMLGSRSKKKGLFVFPLMSRLTGVRYPYLWMKMAQEKGWHVVLDACTLGPKDMDTMGMALIQPDFIICSFYKVFGENPSGFAGLFIKKSSHQVLETSVLARSIGVVSIVRTRSTQSQSGEEEMETRSFSGPLSSTQKAGKNYEEGEASQKREPQSEIVEEDIRATVHDNVEEEEELDQEVEIELRGLNHADSLGLPAIQTRLRCITNWLVIALKKLRHPHSSNGHSLVRIYGPQVKFDRGSAIAFNVYDWKGEKVEPALVQKLADRSNISLNCGFLQNIWFSDHKYEQDKHKILEKRVLGIVASGNRKKESSDVGIAVVSASLGFLVNFEDAYLFWVFVAKFLDADFVEKERWRYVALNQRSVEI
ncbi:molybdenum cofactor sulfurase-like [Dendrobium catenatum]|uniref:Molybdenum cofactor sulfurase n=1 Tax=Dendrobium catenatum TaxID=906689 RepID=A0A2I0VKI1_9ASPA|nr:molybdenum cofactor sulfurase-like [Dendrobium catenatum]PKU63873.1 Molybdenum cofactor sulfurase [Dendrobium catenatum]